MADLRHLPHRLGYQLAGRLAIRQMKPGGVIEQRVGQALARVLRRQLDRNELLWQESIENLRGKMARDDTVLAYTDYGADDPDRADVRRTIAGVVEDSVPPHQGLALLVLARDLQPETCLELGTCLGVSSAYLASALDLNEHGSLTTIEGGKDLSRVASINFSRLGLRNTRFVTGRFTDVLPGVLQEIAPVDLAYVDGHHDGRATTSYFDLLLRHASPRCVVVFDDIRWSRDMRDAWRSIRAHPQVSASLDLLTFGICVTGSATTHHDVQAQNA